MRISLLLSLCVLLAACTTAEKPSMANSPNVQPISLADNQAVALFAGGCFWCMEPPYEKLDGVVSVVSGFAGGPETNPTYDEVANGRTGHTETVQVIYDSTKVSYERLLEVFWHNIDPLAADRQFCDRGAQYRSAVFYGSEAERELAEEWKARLASRFDAEIQTQIVPETPFYAAEQYHQDFYKTNPGRYYSYREGCGRDRRLAELWGEDAGH